MYVCVHVHVCICCGCVFLCSLYVNIKTTGCTNAVLCLHQTVRCRMLQSLKKLELQLFYLLVIFSINLLVHTGVEKALHHEHHSFPEAKVMSCFSHWRSCNCAPQKILLTVTLMVHVLTLSISAGFY